MRTSHWVLFILASYMTSTGAETNPVPAADPAIEANAVQANIPEQSDAQILKGAKTTAAAKFVEPKEGATIKAQGKNKIQYQVVGDEGVHARLYVDGKESALLRSRTGSYNLKNLVAGNHKLCISALNESHKVVGAKECVHVTAQ